MEENLDLQGIVANLQAENEALREQIAKIKLNSLNLYTLWNFVKSIVRTPQYAIGFVIGVLMTICAIVAFGG